MELTLVFPHQLFEQHPAVSESRTVCLIEDSLFFGDPENPLSFHRHKLLLHRATMTAWQRARRREGYVVDMVPYRVGVTARDLLRSFAQEGVRKLHIVYLSDYLLTRRIEETAAKVGMTIVWYDSPMFISPPSWLAEQMCPEPPRMHHFYTAQRKRMELLLQPGSQKPMGGRWSFDEDNRKPWKKGNSVPSEPTISRTPDLQHIVIEAADSVDRDFSENPGSTDNFWYPITAEEAEDWFAQFLNKRLIMFGPYEDAIAPEGTVLYHSILTPALNIGLITPHRVLQMMEERGLLDVQRLETEAGLLQSVEGFIRQIIGWREYIHGLYAFHGTRQRKSNFWNFHRPMPEAMYAGETGLLPLDTVIRRVLERSYCHHIERLMVAGNAMLLVEVDPHAVYRWFMELFIDAYDWVMVPNVYGMSQFADGGLMASKPYVSGGNYLKKMSSFSGGSWETTWTALFWRFLSVHREFFETQPRMSVLTRRLQDEQWLSGQITRAETFLHELHRRDG